jgi:hypothetical protein
MKLKYPDIVLLMEHGYRYRFFGKDADVWLDYTILDYIRLSFYFSYVLV